MSLRGIWINTRQKKVYDVFLELNREYQTSLIMVTHDLRLAERLEKVYRIVDQKLVQER